MRQTQLCNSQVRCSSPFPWCWELTVGFSCPVLRTVDHTSSITCHYLPGYYTGTKLYFLVTGVNNLSKVIMLRWPAGNRTCDLSITSLMPYHSATLPPLNSGQTDYFLNYKKSYFCKTKTVIVWPGMMQKTATCHRYPSQWSSQCHSAAHHTKNTPFMRSHSVHVAKTD